MHDYDEDNDGRFPDESPVEIRYPRSKQEEQGDREHWPWLAGTIVEQCGPDEWYVCIEVRELAVLRDGRRAPRGTASRNLYYIRRGRVGLEFAYERIGQFSDEPVQMVAGDPGEGRMRQGRRAFLIHTISRPCSPSTSRSSRHAASHQYTTIDRKVVRRVRSTKPSGRRRVAIPIFTYGTGVTTESSRTLRESTRYPYPWHEPTTTTPPNPGNISRSNKAGGEVRVEVKRRVSTGWSVEELGHPGGGGPADGAAGSGGRGAGVDGERVGER